MSYLVNYKNLTLLIIITFLLYYLIIYNNIDTGFNKNKLIENMDDSNVMANNLKDEYTKSLLYKRINRKVNKILKNGKIDIFYNNNNTNISNSFQISKNLEPIGIIRYFRFPLINSYCWLPCNGTTYKASKYPELYRLITNDYSEIKHDHTFTLPNLDGKLVFGRRMKEDDELYTGNDIIVNSGSDGIFMNKNNNSSIYKDPDNAIYHVSDVRFNTGDTDGYESCPWDLIGRVKSGGDISICTNFNNMPPYIGLYAYIKARTMSYQFKFDVD